MKEFKRLALTKKVLTDGDAHGYRVFNKDGVYVDVEATLVSEAIEKSGVVNPLKVIRIGSSAISIFESSALKDPVTKAEPAPPADTPAPPSPAEAPAA